MWQKQERGLSRRDQRKTSVERRYVEALQQTDAGLQDTTALADSSSLFSLSQIQSPSL